MRAMKTITLAPGVLGRDCRRLPSVGVPSTPRRRLLLVHAHPDDETIATGGTIASYAAAGVAVALVTCTLGEEGEVIPRELGMLAAGQADQLGGYRVGELRAACAELGVADHRFLGGVGRWRDSGMAGTAANEHPRALVGGDRRKQADQLATILAAVRPQVVVTYDPHGGYGHPDHVRAHEITMAATHGDAHVARVFHIAADPPAGTSVDVRAQLPAKLTALRAHATQVSVWHEADGGAFFALSNGIPRAVTGQEHFAIAEGDPTGSETDLFGGLPEAL
jgi:N-acetyl-1-D-myo-inositol-2-amino-2-deoxy-alpha-D-glucopyranoside deacetylase